MLRKNAEGLYDRYPTVRQAEYVRNEVLVKTIGQARNDDLPHYQDVAAGKKSATASYGDWLIDGLLDRMNIRPRSIARVFIPRLSAQSSDGADKREKLSNSPSQIPSKPISAKYEEDEHMIGLSRTYRFSFETQVNVEQVCRTLLESPAIESARPNYIVETQRQPPNIRFYSQQWGLQTINCEAAWEVETGHPNALIAIVDSGVHLAHSDLASKIRLIPGKEHDFVAYGGDFGASFLPLGDFQVRDSDPDDEDGHGTHCAGIAAAATQDGGGVAGVCWGGQILPVRVMFRATKQGQILSLGTDADIGAGIKFAVDQGAQVINLSLGGALSFGTIHEREEAIQYAHDRKVCLLSATGNQNTQDASFPASSPMTLAVGALERNLTRAWFSNHGQAYNQFVVAPGVAIASTGKGDTHVSESGTSMATAFVSGLTALIVSLSMQPGGRQLTTEEIYEIIRNSTRPLGSGRGDNEYGQGLIDAAAALEATRQKLGG